MLKGVLRDPKLHYSGLHEELWRILDEEHQTGSVSSALYAAVRGCRPQSANREVDSQEPERRNPAAAGSDEEARLAQAPGILTQRGPGPVLLAQRAFRDGLQFVWGAVLT